MTGSLHEKHGTYHAVVRIDGKQKWISTGIRVTGNNKRRANARLNEILAELEHQKISYSKDTLFTDWIDTWMEQKRTSLRGSTLESYDTNIQKHIRPYFKPLKLTLQTVTPQHIQNYYNKKSKEGQSGNSIRKHNAIIRGALQDALKKNLIPYNPVDRATLPAKKKFVGKAFTEEQANTLLNAINDEPMKPAIIFGMFYGLRKSEILGLRWSDVNLRENTIHICNTVVRVKTRIEEEETKSRASQRTLHIIPETKGYLLALRQQQIENRLLLGSSYHKSDHVCVWPDGRPFSPDYLSKHLTLILRDNNLPHIRFHDLRHTAGSLLLNRGLSIKQIQEYLGHEQASTTLDIYGHLSLEGKKEASIVMGSLLEKTLD